MSITPTHHADLSFGSSPFTSPSFDTTGDDWAILILNDFSAGGLGSGHVTSIQYNGTEHISTFRTNAATAHDSAGSHGVCAFNLGADAGNHTFVVTWSTGGSIDFQVVSGTGVLDAAIYDGAATSTEDAATGNVSTPTPYTSTTLNALPFFTFDASVGGGSGAISALANCTKYQASGLVPLQAFFYCPLASAGGSTSATINNTSSAFNLTFAMALKPAVAAPTGGAIIFRNEAYV